MITSRVILHHSAVFVHAILIELLVKSLLGMLDCIVNISVPVAFTYQAPVNHAILVNQASLGCFSVSNSFIAACTVIADIFPAGVLVICDAV